jgi:cysteinyl-tRNA synthetase
MNDDFNSPILIAQLFEGVRFINLLHDGKETLNAVDLDIFSNAMNAFILMYWD